jgi:hypothetical protein
MYPREFRVNDPSPALIVEQALAMYREMKEAATEEARDLPGTTTGTTAIRATIGRRPIDRQRSSRRSLSPHDWPQP